MQRQQVGNDGKVWWEGLMKIDEVLDVLVNCGGVFLLAFWVMREGKRNNTSQYVFQQIIHYDDSSSQPLHWSVVSQCSSLMDSLDSLFFSAMPCYAIVTICYCTIVEGNMKAPFSTISSQQRSFKIGNPWISFPKPSPGSPVVSFLGSWRSIPLVQSPWWAPSFPARRRRRASRSGAAAVRWMVPWNLRKYQENQLRGCIFVYQCCTFNVD